MTNQTIPRDIALWPDSVSLIRILSRFSTGLGFDPAEATVLQMRANLMSDLRLYIEKQKLTQQPWLFSNIDRLTA